MNQTPSVQFGPHTIHYAAPDLLFMTLQGDLSSAEFSEILEDVYRVMARSGHTFTLCDVTRLNPMTQKVRRTAYQGLRSKPPYRGSTAVFGASTPVRLLFTFLMNALRLVTGRGNEEIGFFKDREGALSWLLGRRLALTGVVLEDGCV